MALTPFAVYGPRDVAVWTGGSTATYGELRASVLPDSTELVADASVTEAEEVMVELCSDDTVEDCEDASALDVVAAS